MTERLDGDNRVKKCFTVAAFPPQTSCTISDPNFYETYFSFWGFLFLLLFLRHCPTPRHTCRSFCTSQGLKQLRVEDFQGLSLVLGTCQPLLAV